MTRLDWWRVLGLVLMAGGAALVILVAWVAAPFVAAALREALP